MSRTLKLFVLIATGIALVAVAGKLLAAAALTVLLPVYALVLAILFLIAFEVAASLIAPIAQSVLDKQETTTKIHKSDRDEGRRAA
jgi:membrane protein implicated in regulation of membrane protease activity